MTGSDPGVAFAEATSAALKALESHKARLSERVAEKAVREAFLKGLPGSTEVASRQPVIVSIDVAGMVSDELARFERALAAADLAALINRYPVRETPALGALASRLGFQNRAQYEAEVRKLLLDDEEILKFVRDIFGDLATLLS